MGAFLNCGIARVKINRPEHTAGGSQNKGTENLQRRAGPSPLEVGGRGEGKRANSAPEKPPPPTLQTGLRVLDEDFLRPDWRCVLGPRREKARPTRGERAPKPLAAWAARRGGIRRAAPGRVRPSLWLPEPPRPGKAQNAGATESALLWSTRKLEPHSTQGPLHIEQPGA